MEYSQGLKKLLSLAGWRQFLKILSKKEKFIFFLFFFLFLTSFIFLLINFYFKNTEIQPAEGGIFIEGMIGSPRFINPIYALTFDIDRDLIEFIFSGLMKYNNQGQIVSDLVKEYEVDAQGKVYILSLKENIFWSDGQPLTANDVIFTIKTIQNPEIKSPLRVSWLEVEVEKISDLKIRFELKKPYRPFLENLTLKIIPEHIWKDISPQNFPLVIYNLKPVGSGPYKFKNIIQDQQGNVKSLTLIKNQNYFDKKPYISQIIFKFFNSEEELIQSIKKRKIKGFSINYPSKNNLVKIFSLPRYFAVFFNPEKSKLLDKKNIRKVLNYGTNKEEIIKETLSDYGKRVDSPILPEIYGFSLPSKIYQFDLEKAKNILDEAGFIEKENNKRVKIIKKIPAFQFKNNLKLGSKGEEVRELQKCLAKDSQVYPEGEITGYFGEKTKMAVIRFQEKYQEEILKPFNLKSGTGIVLKATRDKLNKLCIKPSEEILTLKFTLVTVNQAKLIKVANLLKEQWERLGIEIEIKTFDVLTLERDIIKIRDYEMLLFGEVLGIIPDPFPFWHSSQKKDPGLNLAFYENKKSDKLLEEARQTQDDNKRKDLLEKFQEILIEDAPVVFLYNPNYLYFVSKEIKGGIKESIIANPSKRFEDIENWYIKTKRIWKK